MSSNTQETQELLFKAAQLALEGKWEEAHTIVQEYEGDPLASRIHGILHKIEGDIANAKYWYRQAGAVYSTMDPQRELSQLLEEQRGK